MRFLSICPRISKKSGCVVATTGIRVLLLLLGAVHRRVVIDPAKATLSISSRYLWLIRFHREISFSQIKAVTYGYEDESFGSMFAFAHDSFDWFTVGLRLSDGSETHLFNFIGDGTFSNNGPLPDWLYWDDFAFDMSGSQDKESRVFVDLLAQMIDTTVVPPRMC
jgi:hypothetical protein